MDINILNQFSLKGLKTFNTHDGYAYNCTLMIGNVKIATIENGGYGGSTNYHFLSIDAQNLFNETIIKFNIREYLFNNGYDFMVCPNKITDEDILSTIVEEFISHKDWVKIIKKLEKNSILYGIVNSPNILYVKYKMPLEAIVSRMGGKDILQNKITEIKSKLTGDQIILNTNLEKIGLTI